MPPFPHRKQLASMMKEARVSRVLHLEIVIDKY
jgi:Mg2+/Co2+ transporter CorC